MNEEKMFVKLETEVNTKNAEKLSSPTKVEEITEIKNKNANTLQQYKCLMCDKTFAQYQLLKTHEVTHLGEKQYECDICQKSFKYARNFKNHQQIHENFQSFNCTLCDKSFRLNILLNKHLRTHNNKKQNNRKLSSNCSPDFADEQRQMVPENFTNIVEITEQTNYPEKEKAGHLSLECETQIQENNDEEIVVKIEPEDICNDDFPDDRGDDPGTTQEATSVNSDNIGEEKNIRSRYKERYKCNACDKEFKFPCDLEIHSRIHIADRPFQCSACEKTFKRKDALKRHKFTHTGIKPYECDVCRKNFNQMSTLIKHKRIHDNIRPYKCQQCNKSYTSGTNLASHVRIHH